MTANLAQAQDLLKGLDLKVEIDESILVPATPESVKYDEIVREIIPLEESDLEALQLDGPYRSQSGIQHLRAFHHNIALRLAAGEKPVAISASLAVSQQTISRLAKDPHFGELIESYRNKLVDKTVDHFEIAGLVSAEALTAIHERLCGGDRDNISLETLRKLYESSADRTGHSPVRRSETLSRHSLEVSNEVLARIKALHPEDSTYDAEIIESTSVEVHEEESEGAGAAVSISGAFEPVSEDPYEGESSGGEGV